MFLTCTDRESTVSHERTNKHNTLCNIFCCDRRKLYPELVSNTKESLSSPAQICCSWNFIHRFGFSVWPLFVWKRTKRCNIIFTANNKQQNKQKKSTRTPKPRKTHENTIYNDGFSLLHVYVHTMVEPPLPISNREVKHHLAELVLR